MHSLNSLSLLINSVNSSDNTGKTKRMLWKKKSERNWGNVAISFKEEKKQTWS